MVPLLLGLLHGCASVGPDYQEPESTTPDQWHQDLEQGLAGGEPDYRTWWTSLNDPVLDGLIGRATEGNLDLRIAFARINEARARLGIQTGRRWPDLNANGTLQRERVSDGVMDPVTTPQKRNDTFRGIGFDGSWEIDFWGRVRRSIESAGAEYDASIEGYRDVLVTLYAEVARNYISVRTLQERIRLALENVKTQRGTLELVTVRERVGLVPKLDIRQAELNLATSESIVPDLDAERIAAINRLSVLLGEPPGAMHAELEAPKPIPGPPEQAPVGLPGELVRNRPDLRRAERDLAAQTARIGVATAELYPTFSILGAFSYASFTGSEFQTGRRAYSVGPFFSWNLFDGGRVRSLIDERDAMAERSLQNYERTLLAALEDVENAMTGFARERVRREALDRSVVAAQESVRLVKIQYFEGLTNFQNVLDMERSLFRQQDLEAESEGRVSQNLVRIYRSLGGGWDADAPAGPVNELKAADEGQTVKVSAAR
jgi:NodT family efflux transporter outer membrane factor (OMF) lipoprotein